MDTIKTERELIEKWKLNKGFLASQMGMLKGTFCNKLSANHDTQFKSEEKGILQDILIELASDILDKY